MVSIVVPLYNEEDAAPLLIDAVRDAMGAGEGWELVLVDDGSRDHTAAVVGRSISGDARMRLLRLKRNYGQSTAMQAGFDHARGEVVVSMDGDLQNDPRDIPRLVARLGEGFDLVAGYRENRQDKLVTRRIPSWFANRIIGVITGVAIRDNGCSLKAYRRETLERLRLYADLHRFIPAQAAATAAARITEIAVRHHPRHHGASKYGLSRIPKVVADLLTILMIRSFRERPLVLFASAAALALCAGGVFGALPLLRLFQSGGTPAGGFLLSGAALLCFWLAGYLLMLGLIAEEVLYDRLRQGRASAPLLREEVHS